jgi:hypothetical protein
MKIPVVLSLLLLMSPAIAQVEKPLSDKPLCVDATRGNNYNARPISLHEVLARNSMGDMRGVRLGTTCIHIDRAATVGLHSMIGCIGKGDEVGVSVPGGQREMCRVTSISTVAEDYAKAEYKY